MERKVNVVENLDGNKIVLYLYDIMNIKKETSILFQSDDLTQ